MLSACRRHVNSTLTACSQICDALVVPNIEHNVVSSDIRFRLGALQVLILPRQHRAAGCVRVCLEQGFHCRGLTIRKRLGRHALSPALEHYLKFGTKTSWSKPRHPVNLQLIRRVAGTVLATLATSANDEPSCIRSLNLKFGAAPPNSS